MKHALQLLGPSGLGLVQVALRVFDRVSEHEEAVSDRFKLLAGDDELVFAEPELEGAATGFEVALSARPLAVQPRTPLPAATANVRPHQRHPCCVTVTILGDVRADAPMLTS